LSKAARRLLLKPAMAPEAPEVPSEEWGWSRTALERFSARTALTWVDASVRPANARSVTYASLVACASKVTDLIRRLDDETPASSPIALCLDNGLSFVTCMLGALWAGHSFMPVAIDPQVIQMQMLGMLAQMHVKILFCAPELVPAVQAVVARCAHPVHVCVLDDDEVLFPAKARHCMALARSLYGAYSDAPVLPALPRARCHERVCTFHTSGTTGTPKPIHNSHAEWAAFVRAAAAAYHMTADSRVFVATSHIFDPSAGLTFAALALGASACLAPWAHTLTELRASIELTHATHACSTPSVWELYELGMHHAADDDDAQHTAATTAAHHASASASAAASTTASATATATATATLPHAAASGTPPGTPRDSEPILGNGTPRDSEPKLGDSPILGNLTPSSTLQTVMLGGEPMPVALVRRWLRRGVRLINTYGTTEATVYQATHEIPQDVAELDEETIREHAHTIGIPFEGIQMSVIRCADDDEGHQEAGGMARAMGSVGTVQAAAAEQAGEEAEARGGLVELVLHGVQVDGGSAAGFRTGDLVRRSVSGQWLFAGRADRQVKLDGRRIELGPIEEVISRRMRPLVQRTVVQLVGSPRRLHAFCQLEQPESLGAASGELAMAHAATVRQLCALELPRYLVPAGVTFLERLPVTPTGKLDQRTLALLHERQCSLAASAELCARSEESARDGMWSPDGSWLHTVACCWAAELGLPLSRLSARSNFQRLSGNSLVALRIGSRLWQQRVSCRAELGGDRICHSEFGGAFGERMGVFAPITLLTTPVLEEYAQATAPAASEAAFDEAPSTEEVVSIPLDEAPSTEEVDSIPFDEAPSTEEVDSIPVAAARPTQLGSCSADPNSAVRPSSSSSEIDELAGQAVSLDAVALLRLLLLQHDYTHTVDNDLLIAAARSSSNGCAELLLQHGASPNAIGFGALTALHFALQRRNTVLAQLLLMTSDCMLIATNCLLEAGTRAAPADDL